jgi:hypothetical protein
MKALFGDVGPSERPENSHSLCNRAWSIVRGRGTNNGDEKAWILAGAQAAILSRENQTDIT